MKGQLKLIVLRILSKKDMSGYELMKAIEKSTGFWKPSFGSIYPLLDSLLNEKIIVVKKAEEKGKKRKIYSLSEHGKLYFKEIMGKKDQIMNSMMDNFRISQSIMGHDKKESEFMEFIFENMKKDKIPFAPAYNEMNELRFILLEMMKDGRMEKNREDIRKLLINTNSQLKKMR